jgi:hypothetical protein
MGSTTKVSIGGETQVEFTPNFIVRPGVDVLVGRNLQVKTPDLRGAHAQQSEAALVIRVDQFI